MMLEILHKNIENNLIFVFDQIKLHLVKGVPEKLEKALLKLFL